MYFYKVLKNGKALVLNYANSFWTLMDNNFARLSAINKLRADLDNLASSQQLGSGRFQKWDLFHGNGALIIKKLFGENSRYFLDWLTIEIPEDPQIDDNDGFLTYLHDKEIAKQKMINQLEIMAKDIVQSKEIKKKQVNSSKNNRKKVFIVHGTDHEPANELKAILEDVNLQPLILEDLPCASKTIVEKLEMYSNVDFAFVILTPDDKGCQSGTVANLISSFASAMKPPTGGVWLQMLQSRARQNAILEFGYFIGKLGREKVCYLRKETVEIPSDMNGIVYIPFVSSIKEIRQKILKELAQSGIIKF
jgi:predicted nucleotide-binding protein